MIEKTARPYRSGYVAVIGRPNVGKSTLMNAYLGQMVAAISPRPQTTRRRQLGILTTPETQIVFVDTPGMHEPEDHLGKHMNKIAEDALLDADIILWLTAGDEAPGREDRLIGDRLRSIPKRPPVIMAMNKSDLLDPALLSKREELYASLLPGAVFRVISASTGEGRQELLDTIVSNLPEGRPFFEEEQVTDLYEREIAIDLIRAAAMRLLRDEVPHSVAIALDEYKDRADDMAYIAATLYVERESQKGILIGKSGEMLKKIGTEARKTIEAMTDRKVYLDLHVKVAQNWRNDPRFLKQLGYRSEKEK